MITRLLCLFSLSLVTLTAAPDPTPEDLLRQGLFEEEANRDLDKAAENYRAVIAAHDRQRALAASATFRLGEIARKKNDNEAAATAFRTVVERFPEQQEIARLSAENLAALGMAPDAKSPAVNVKNDPEDVEIARLQEIARNSPDLLDGAGSDGWRPLHHAAAKGWIRVVSYLLENHANPDGRTITEQLTPLQLASIHGYLGSVNALLAAKADVNATFNIKSCPEGVLPVADKSAKNADGKWSALDLAILYDRREVARALIEAGTDLKRVGPVTRGWTDGFTPLQLAISLKRNDLAQVLIAAGSPVDRSGENNPITPLGLAIRDNPEMVVPLLKAGADPKQPYSEDRVTPLQGAARINRFDTAKLLLDAGADVNAKDMNGLSPLHWAFTPEMDDFLVANGADPNSKTTAGLTPLDVIADYRTPLGSVIEALLKHGATVEDPIALLRRSSPENLDAVRELIVYPRAFNPDAIQLSVSGSYSLREPEIPQQQGQTPLNMLPSEKRPDLVTVEIRPAAASPPHSIPELLREAFSGDSLLASIRILRHDAATGFKPILEWTFASGAPLPEELPALQWGDLVEVQIQNGYRSDQKPPSIDELVARIPTRDVIFSLAGLEIPKTISGSDTFWLDCTSWQALGELIPNIGEIADLSHFVIHRKGVAEPIKLDFAEPTRDLFRLIDGDRIELSLNVPELDRQFGESEVITSIKFFGNSGFSGTGDTSLINQLGNVDKDVDFYKILLLRRAEKWKPEVIDIKAWLEALPPKEEWTREILDPLKVALPKLDPGDVLVFLEEPDSDSRRSANDTREKLQSVGDALRRFPRVVPPPSSPSH
jgi:ankyrin repeat protein